MGLHTNIYGYIAIAHDAVERNEHVWREFEFDEVFPFPMVFSQPHPGYDWVLVSFAYCIKGREDVWPLWQERFEQLLQSLDGALARVHYELEANHECIAEYARDYATPPDEQGRTTWTRSTIRQSRWIEHEVRAGAHTTSFESA